MKFIASMLKWITIIMVVLAIFAHTMSVREWKRNRNTTLQMATTSESSEPVLYQLKDWYKNKRAEREGRK